MALSQTCFRINGARYGCEYFEGTPESQRRATGIGGLIALNSLFRRAWSRAVRPGAGNVVNKLFYPVNIHNKILEELYQFPLSAF